MSRISLPYRNGSARRVSSLIFLLGPLLLLAADAGAQLPVARLTSLFPPGGRAGSEVEVTVSGQELDDLKELHFSTTNLTARPKPNEGNKFIVTIATNAVPGVVEARVVGRFGISNPRAFTVGDLPEGLEKSGNNTAATAAEITPGSVVNGKADANAADFYKFAARPGQRVLIDCAARNIDSRMQAVLTLSDAAGRELERSRRGEPLDFTAPAEGVFVVRVHDHLFRGGGEHFYRLTVGTGPRVDFILPPAGLPGAKGRFTLYGRNLPGGAPAAGLSIDGKPLESLDVEIEVPGDALTLQRLATSRLVRAAEASTDGFEYRLASPQGASNPVFIGFASAPVAAEQEPNNQIANAQAITPPCEIAGQFFPAGDRDVFTFEAKKGEVWWLGVLSQRLGLPTDPFVLVQRVTKNDKGEEKLSDVLELSDNDTNLGGNEFKTQTRDPAARFEVKEDGAYRLTVRDLFAGTQASPAHIYRLAIRKEAPDFRLLAFTSGPPNFNKDIRDVLAWSPLLRRGGSLPVKVVAFRRDGFGGAIQLSAESLPPGVKCEPVTVAADANSATLVFTAAEDAPGWTGPLTILGRSTLAGTELVREARAASVLWNVGDFNLEAVQSRVARNFTLSLTGAELVPVALDPAEAKPLETSVAAKAQIPVRITRRDGFSANLKVRTLGIGALEGKPEFEIDGKATNATLEIDLAQQKLPAGSHTFYLQAQTAGKYRRLTPDEVKTCEETVKTSDQQAAEADKALGDLKSTAKQAAEAVAATTKAAQEAEAQSKTAADKLGGVKLALEKSAADETLLAAKTEAEKVTNDLAPKLKTAAEARAAAEKASAIAAEKLKEAEAKKTAAANRAKEARARMEAKDVNATFYSSAIRLNVLSAPVKVAAEAPSQPLVPGSKTEIPVTLQRLFGFTEGVELTLEIPKDAKGITAAKLTVPKDQSQAKLLIEAAADATPGEHALTLLASLKFNGQDLKTDQKLAVKIAAAQQALAK